MKNNQSQADEAMKQSDVSDIAGPNLILAVDRHPIEQIGIDLMFRAGPAGQGLGIDGVKPHEPHETSHPSSFYMNGTQERI